MLRYRRIVLKMSGEVLGGAQGVGLASDRLQALAQELDETRRAGVQIGLVVGGGNIFRGAQGSTRGFDRVSGDQMGMLATVINSLAVQDALQQAGVEARVLSAIPMPTVAEGWNRARAVEHLEHGRVVIFAAGTGNPFFTTDTAGVLRALEVDAEALLKGTKVDGVYDADPVANPKAVRFTTLTHAEALRRNLRVMDASAFSLAMERELPIIVFDISRRGDVVRIARGESVGTLVGKG
jgi:uridylate kinase